MGKRINNAKLYPSFKVTKNKDIHKISPIQRLEVIRGDKMNRITSSSPKKVNNDSNSATRPKLNKLKTMNVNKNK